MNQAGMSPRSNDTTSPDGRDTLPPPPASATDSLSEGVELVSAGPPETPLPGQFGRYTIEKSLGQGAMGAVYLAHDRELDRQVALKVPRFADIDSPEYHERFYREARAAATLRHAHICPVYDVGEIDGKRYISMAYVEGRLLSERIESGRLPTEDEAAELIRKLADALHHAHRKGVIHRDLKPSNVMIDQDGEPTIMDFGVARRINRTEERRLTHSGALIGSPAYMSPEQIEDGAGAVGPASDIYSLGVMLYELLTGQLPFAGSVASVIGQIVTRDPPPPSARRPDLDGQLEAICLKMMAKQPAQRYATMEAVSDALDEFLRSRRESETVAGKSQPTTAVNRARDAQPTKAVVAPATQGVTAAPDIHGRVSIPRSVLWGAIAMVAVGFGLTWWMMSIALQQREELSNRIEFDNAFREALQEQAATLYVDGTPLSQQELDNPVPLKPGSHRVEIRKGDEVMMDDEYTVAEGERRVLNIKFVDGNFIVREDEALEVTSEPAAAESNAAGQPPATAPVEDRQ